MNMYTYTHVYVYVSIHDRSFPAQDVGVRVWGDAPDQAIHAAPPGCQASALAERVTPTETTGVPRS